jgi:hypothetical protein
VTGSLPKDFATACWTALAVMLLLVVAGSANGAGQALHLQRPVLDHDLKPAKAAEYEDAVSVVMTMSEEEMLGFLPEYSYSQFCECPNCYGGVRGSDVFTWTIERPDEMVCRYCGTVFPNEKYPETRELTGQNALGEQISFPYYFNEKKEVPHFLSNHLIALRRGWMRRQTVALAQAYRVTGKAEYARRVALVLDYVAQRYPHYPAMGGRTGRAYRFHKPQTPPYRWDAGKWGNFHNEIPVDLVRAYDLIYDSEELDKVSEERGYDVREKVENDLLKPAYAAVIAKPDHISNVVGYDVTSAAILGRVIGEPQMVHWGFAWMVANVNEAFYADGMWKEGSPSYHYMAIGGLRRAFESVRGYTDPPGYTHPETGRRFDDLNPEQAAPFWAKVQDAPSVINLPDGRRLPVHDSWFNQRYRGPSEQSRSAILPAFGHAILGHGSGSNQVQAHLHFSGDYGHRHYDNLNLILWGKEREMLPDIGYSMTQMRYWTMCSLGHNLVVVDRQDQVGPGSDGNLLCYFPEVEGVAVVEADGSAAYREIEGLDMYRRMLVLIPVSDAGAYVLDLFRVRGGSVHDWTINGDAGEDTVFSTTLVLDGRRENLLEAGEEWVEPTMIGHRFNPYGLVRDVESVTTANGFHVDFQYVEMPEKCIRVHMVSSDEQREVFLGRSPSVRRMGAGTDADMRKAYDHWMPKLLVRNTGQAPVASVFTAVHEPFEDTAVITSVKRLEVTPPDDNAVALRVTHGDTTDIIISTLDEAPYPERTTANGISLRGRLGILRQVNGKTTAGWLFDGEQLRYGEWSIEAPVARYTAQLQAVMRKAEGADEDAFVTEAHLPDDGTLDGFWMVVTHGDGKTTRGFEIQRIEHRNGRTLAILANDPGLQIEGDTTSEVYHPKRSFQGANSFVISCAAGLSEPR